MHHMRRSHFDIVRKVRTSALTPSPAKRLLPAILQAQGIVPLDQPVAKPADKQPAEAGPSNRPAKRRRTDNGATEDERPGSGSGSDSRAGTEGAPDLAALQVRRFVARRTISIAVVLTVFIAGRVGRAGSAEGCTAS